MEHQSPQFDQEFALSNLDMAYGHLMHALRARYAEHPDPLSPAKELSFQENADKEVRGVREKVDKARAELGQPPISDEEVEELRIKSLGIDLSQAA